MDQDDQLKKAIESLHSLRADWIEDTRLLNIQSAVFFATTVGCWSVPPGWLRYTAFGASFTFFLYALAVLIVAEVMAW